MPNHDQNLKIIQVYIQTSESSEKEIKTFYEQLKTALKHTKKDEVTSFFVTWLLKWEKKSLNMSFEVWIGVKEWIL